MSKPETNEKGLLACMINHPEQIPDILDRVGDPEDLFDDLNLQIILDSVLKVFNETDSMPMPRLEKELTEKFDQDPTKSFLDILNIYECETFESDWLNYVGPLISDRFRRRTIRQTSKFLTDLKNPKISDNQTCEWTLSELQKIAEGQLAVSKKTRKELFAEIFADMELAQTQPDSINGIRTGFPGIDSKLRGLRPGNVFVIGARPGCGKSSIAVSMMLENSFRNKIPSLFFSMEMSELELLKKMLHMVSGVRNRLFLERSEIDRVVNASLRLMDSPFTIDDTCGLSPGLMRARISRAVKTDSIEVVFIDYLQLMECKGANRQEQIGAISRQIKKMAKEFEIPIVVLCQLNRESEKSAGRPPRLSDLRESGAIEQDADAVGLISMDLAESDGTSIQAEFIIAKNRRGPTGNIDLVFKPETTTFETVSIYNHDEPHTTLESLADALDH
jgi:replicative DNA helicase